MTQSFSDGKFVFESRMTIGEESVPFRITLDLNNWEIRHMVLKAHRNTSRQSVEAGGALKARVLK